MTRTIETQTNTNPQLQVEGTSVSPVAKPAINIVGFAQSWVQAPWHDLSQEIWGMNALHKLADARPDLNPRFNRWYQLHDIDSHHRADRDEHVAWLRNSGLPVIMWPEHVEKYGSEIPNAFPYPKLAVTEMFGRYFTNTVSWMIAHAIFEQRPHIGVFGIDMAQDSEYAHQRPSCEFFLGWAVGAGISLHIPDTSDLLKAPFMYGAEDGNPMRIKMESRLEELTGRKNEVQNQINQLTGQLQQATTVLHQILGAEEDTRYYLRAWTMPQNADGKVPT